MNVLHLVFLEYYNTISYIIIVTIIRTAARIVPVQNTVSDVEPVTCISGKTCIAEINFAIVYIEPSSVIFA